MILYLLKSKKYNIVNFLSCDTFYQASYTFRNQQNMDIYMYYLKMRLNCLITFKLWLLAWQNYLPNNGPPTLLSIGIWNNNLIVAYLNFILSLLHLLETCILSLSQWLIRTSLTISYLQWLPSRNPFPCSLCLSWILYNTNYIEDIKSPTIWLRDILSLKWASVNCIKNFKWWSN